jgi:quinol monooxygenase YgiN
MELLVATLAHTAAGKDVDGLARLRFISDTVRNAPGLVNAHFYRSREPESYYFMLTTWEDEEIWQKAQDRYNLKNLLIGSAGGLLTTPPEQWLMHYLWGYSRPSAQPTIAAAHLATIRPDQANRVERGWIEGLRRQAAQPTLAFAFLARGRNEDSALPQQALTPDNKVATSVADGYSSHFLNLLSWPGESQRKEFYADQNYRVISGFLSSLGIVRVFALDPQ